MLNAACTSVQKVKVTVNPKTDPTSTNPEGLPATLDGAISGEVVSGDGTFEADPTDPKSGYLVSGPGAGDTVYNINGDADKGSGVRTITDQITLTVTEAEASGLGLTLGAPEPK